MRLTTLPFFFVLALLVGSSQAKLKDGNAGDSKPLTTAQQLASFTVPEGFIVELVAGEEQGVVNPISLAFDDAGRLWTQTARAYPADKDMSAFKGAGPDQILIFDNPTQRQAQTPRVFVDGVAMPTGLLPYKNGVLAIIGPELLRFTDSDGDGKADKRDVLLSGFGIQDTHTGAHQLEYGPGGWVNFSQGVLALGTVTSADGIKTPFNRSLFARVRPDGTRLQVTGAGTNNAWAWAMDRQGRVFTHEANDFGYSQILWERDATYPAFIKTTRYPDSIMHPPTAQGLGLGGTGFSGIAISEGANGFPDTWRGVNFVANPITRTINTVGYETDAQGVIRFSKKANLLSSSDPMFRPVYVLFGPDGCLYIADWYNGIISHNEVSRDHPHRNKTHGRIWRVRHQSQQAGASATPATADAAGLLKMLESDNAWVQRAAWRQLVTRPVPDAIPALKTLASHQRPDVAIHALWSLEGLGAFDQTVWQAAIGHSNPNIRHEAVRAMSTLQVPLDTAQSLLSKLPADPSFRVRNEAVRFFRDRHHQLTDAHKEFVQRFAIPDSKLSKKKVKGWKGTYLALGGAYEGAFLNLLVKKAIEGEGPEAFNSAPWLTEIDKHEIPAATKQARRQRIADLTTFILANPQGDLAKGEAHFKARCSHCHSMDSSGKGFAPPLSGGASRSIEGTVTAIVSPSEAMEELFRAYRVTQKNGAMVEGFLADINAKDLTLTFMGGAQQKIPLKQVTKGGYVAGKSVMPAGLDAGMSHEDVRDLTAFLRQIPAPLRKVEFESLGKPVDDKAKLAHVQKPGGRFNAKTLSQQRHIFMPFRQAGQSVTYRVPVAGESAVPLKIGLTTCLDFGIIDVSVNGKIAQSGVDVYSPDLAVKSVDLGTHKPVDGGLNVTIKLAAANSKGRGSRTFAGVDYVMIGGEPGQPQPAKKKPAFKKVPPTSVSFRKQVLFDKYLSEGASVGDLDSDGHLDVVAGAAWWKGPDFTQKFAYEPIKIFPITGKGLSGYSTNFFTFPDELTNDKWTDVIKVGIPGQPAHVALNPGATPMTWENCKKGCASHPGPGSVCNESPQYLDIIGDSTKEMLLYTANTIAIAVPTKAATPTWEILPISPKGRFPTFSHGLGAGDINGDGRQDILEKLGWWEQPANWDRKSHWTYHKYPFAPRQGGAQMFAYDINGDGLNDVVTALNAHQWGMAWYEQVRTNGKIDFKAHTVMTDKPSGNPYGVVFSQPHAMDCADIDGDGIKDVVTGKCYYAHNGRDPGAEDPAVLYWFRTVRHADGSAELIPYLIDDNSGVGRQVTVADVNKDGKPDVITSNKKGVYAFIQE